MARGGRAARAPAVVVVACLLAAVVATQSIHRQPLQSDAPKAAPRVRGARAEPVCTDDPADAASLYERLLWLEQGLYKSLKKDGGFVEASALSCPRLSLLWWVATQRDAVLLAQAHGAESIQRMSKVTHDTL